VRANGDQLREIGPPHRFWDYSASCGSGLSVRVDHEAMAYVERGRAKGKVVVRGEIKYRLLQSKPRPRCEGCVRYGPTHLLALAFWDAVRLPTYIRIWTPAVVQELEEHENDLDCVRYRLFVVMRLLRTSLDMESARFSHRLTACSCSLRIYQGLKAPV